MVIYSQKGSSMRIEAFYNFMKERELIRLRKEDGEPFPWTDDPNLQTYKFTNVKRKLNRLRKQNTQLRSSGVYWYEIVKKILE